VHVRLPCYNRTDPLYDYQDHGIMMSLRKQAIRVGLITEETSYCLSFCSESEASAVYCVSRPYGNLYILDWRLISDRWVILVCAVYQDPTYRHEGKSSPLQYHASGGRGLIDGSACVIQRKDRFLVVDAGGGTVVSSQQGSTDYSSIHL
jgi:hypothetical protein